MFMRHPLTLLTNEIPRLDLTRENVCLLLQDVHAPFADAESGWLAARMRSKMLNREFDEYFETLDVIAPNISRLVTMVREIGLPVAYSCLGYRQPHEPSAFQAATGWLWDLDGVDGKFDERWRPRVDEPVFSKPGWGALSNDQFVQFLKESELEYVIAVGVLFDLGIRQTCIELADRGIGSLVVSDAVASTTDLGQTFTRGNISQGLIKMRTTGELADLLGQLHSQGFVSI